MLQDIRDFDIIYSTPLTSGVGLPEQRKRCRGGPGHPFRGWGSSGGRVLPRWTTLVAECLRRLSCPRCTASQGTLVPLQALRWGERTEGVNRACSPTPACWLRWCEGLIFFFWPPHQTACTPSSSRRMMGALRGPVWGSAPAHSVPCVCISSCVCICVCWCAHLVRLLASSILWVPFGSPMIWMLFSHPSF